MTTNYALDEQTTKRQTNGLDHHTLRPLFHPGRRPGERPKFVSWSIISQLVADQLRTFRFYKLVHY